MVGYTSLAVFLFSAIALVIASGFSLGALLLILGSAALPWKRPRLALGKNDRLLIAALALYFGVTAASNAYHGAQLREYDAPLRFLLAIPALLLLLAYPAKPGALWSGLAIGAIGGGVFSGWQNLVEGQLRPGGTTNPIQYGDISLLLGILCLCGMVWALARQCPLSWRVLLGAGAASGLLGALFTGSRGSLIALPFCLGILAILGAGDGAGASAGSGTKAGGGVDTGAGKRVMRAGLLALAALIALAYFMPRSTLRARSDIATRELRAYFDDGNINTSVGARLELWRSGLAMVPQHPWLGWGKQGYMRGKRALVEQGKIAVEQGEEARAIARHTHLHNEYLDALVKRGVAGLAALLVLFLAPLALFARQLGDPGGAARPYALGGVLLCVSYMLFGLTQAFLTHNNGVMMFAFLLIMLWAALRAEQRRAQP